MPSWPLSRKRQSLKNQCIQSVRKILSGSNIPDVIIDVIINHTFAQYTLYGLCNKKNLYTNFFTSSLQMQPSDFGYKIINHMMNTNNITIANNHLFIHYEGKLYTSSKSHIFHKNFHFIQIGNQSRHNFIICHKQNNSEFDESVTYLFDNNSLQFYCYDHNRDNLIKLQLCQYYRLPPCKVKQVVKNVNNHKLVYYWCLLENGIIFKVVFDHNFFNSIHNQQRRQMWKYRHFISEHGVYDYNEKIREGKHTLDLEVFRLCPEIIPKFIIMASGGNHLLFIDSNHKLWCYGNNKCGQCGIKRTTDTIIQPIPNQLFKNIFIEKIYCGDNRSAVIDNYGRLYLFGDGVETTLRKPYKLLQSFEGFENMKFINGACGDNHWIFVNDMGEVYGLGGNEHGQINNNHDAEKRYNVPIMIEREWIGMSGNGKNEKIVEVIINGNQNYFITSQNVYR